MNGIKKNGGPAFPTSNWPDVLPPDHPHSPGAIIIRELPGMSLRDYFAAQIRIALGNWTPPHAGMESSALTSVEKYENARAARAEYCFAEADAMLAAREVKS